MPRLDELGDPRLVVAPSLDTGETGFPREPLLLRGDAYRTDAGKARIGVDELGRPTGRTVGGRDYRTVSRPCASPGAER